MDTATVTPLVKELNEANAKNQTDDVVRLLKRFKNEIQATEELLRASKVGQAVGKMRNHSEPEVAALAKELVKKWKDAVEAGKKRKREDGDGELAVKAEKKIKAEGTSTAASPAVSTPDAKPSKVKDGKLSAAASASTPPASPGGGGDSAGTSEKASKPRLLSTISFDRKTVRNAASDGMADKLKAEGGEGEDIRNKTVKLIYDALAGDSNADKKILAERAIAIEHEAVEMLNGSTGNDYRAKMRSLYLNLKDAGNPGLRNEIVLGHVSAEKVVTMSKEEMASESVKMLNERIANDNLFKAKSVGETQAETDAFKCGRCQQRKCTYYQMQTRSADEPMTTFVTCTNCGNRWKFS